MKHLFKSLHLAKFSEQDLTSTLKEDLSRSDVSLTFRWSNKRNLVFYKLHLKHLGKTADVLKGASMNESGGVYTFHLGSFENSTELEISVGLLALVTTPKLVVILSQTNPAIAFQASPKVPGTTHKVESGNRFQETIKYTVQ